MRKIQDGEVAVIFFSGVIVSVCGGNLVIERAEVDAFSVYADAGPPFLLCFAPVDAFVSGT